MNYWLEADADDILDEVIEARQLAGEDLDESDQTVRKMVRSDIVASQRDIARMVVETDGMITVYRAIRLGASDIGGFEARGTGECWSFTRAGAFAYDGTGKGDDIIIEARVPEDGIVWAMTVGMWSSGEGEARLDRRASVVIENIRTKSGDPVREDMWGSEYSVSAPDGVGAKP